MTSFRSTHYKLSPGDEGMSDFNGNSLLKSHPSFEASGSIEELNCYVGMLQALMADSIGNESVYIKFLNDIQHHLFLLNNELAKPEVVHIETYHVTWLEAWAEHFSHFIGPLKDPVLPGGSPSAAWAYLAHSVCRRAERRVVQLHELSPQSAAIRHYLNRLSTVIGMFARFLNQQSMSTDTLCFQHHHATLPPNCHEK